ncbi:centrosomal protein of 295 kDa isoform X2 [Hemicordylus capensis]|uniref:centrosomal protein of 295 kDa isoform X2 n=1 Tax=Hemicordylus capensis TaxID=884348 RepID=UPI00230231AF|nr:centrosomal protein of 295 kDa isoform X2 [Hemicordylus capensis]
MYPKMKRKVAKAGGFRLSPNEEALLLKEEHERRRKLRLQQVREQERNIALQIRQDVKQRRDQQLHQLAEELKAEWQKAQDEKIKTLEKLYLSSLRAVGEGHRQAKENKLDVEALAKQAEERKRRAEKRHKEALKQQKNHKQKLLREQIWRANARKHALDVEKERATKIASLPPPPPHPFDNVELKSVPTAKVCDVDSFSVTRHHLFDPYVDREMDVDQPDARLLAEEEVIRQEGLQNEGQRERREQQEKAHLRGKHALKMVRLARDREKLMQELEQMQHMDLVRRRQIVAQMPPQLFEPAYKRVEIKEDWQRELECAFEDMYTADKKMKGDLVLHLDPQPLPALSNRSQDEELEVSQELDSVCGMPPKSGDEVKDNEPDSNKMKKAPQAQAKPALKKLLDKIRNQKSHWTSGCQPETVSEIGTIESGTISSAERRLCESEPEEEPIGDPVSEAKEILDQTIVAGNVVPSHLQEQATKIGKEAERPSQMEWLEHQKQQQLALLQQIEEQKIRLEVDLRTQMRHQEEEMKREQEKRVQPSHQPLQMNGDSSVVHQQLEAEHRFEMATGPQMANRSREDDPIQMIRDYQQRLLMRNRMHKESLEEARRCLQEHQKTLKQRYPSVAAAALLDPAERCTHQSYTPEPALHLQRSDVLKRPNLASQPCKNVLLHSRLEAVQAQPPEHSEHPLIMEEPSEQNKKEQRLDDNSVGQVQPAYSQKNQGPFQLIWDSFSHEEKEKLGVLGMPATQPLAFHGIPGSLLPKSQDTSVTTQPVARTQHIRFTLPSEALYPEKSVSHALLAEKSLLPTSLKQQHILTESRKTPTSGPDHFPPFQPLSSLPTSLDSETGRTQESWATKDGLLPSCSNVVELRERILASSESIQAQQEHLKALQDQLDEQREALLSRQKVQEDLLMQKHARLKQQMEEQQEALKGFLKRTEQSTLCKEITKAQETNSSSFLAMLFKEAEAEDDSSQGEVEFWDTNIHAENNYLVQNIGLAEQAEIFQKVWGREQKWRPPKPPLAKVKLGLDLEQHELSAIPELDTPRSGRLSTPGHKESLTGDTFLSSNVVELQSSKYLNESLREETGILRIIADSRKQSSNESTLSQDHLSRSWCEKLGMEAGGLQNQVYPREPTHVDRDLPSTTADTGGRTAVFSDPLLRSTSAITLPAVRSPDLISPLTSAQEAACSYLSSFTISSESFITNENPDRSLASTGLCSAKEDPRHISLSLKEKANTSWDLSVSRCNQDDSSDAPDPSLSFGETPFFERNKIQQIIDKYRRDLSWSSLSNISSIDPAVGLDVSDIKRNFPNFHREHFQPLEPNPDVNPFSSLSQCKITRGIKDLGQSSDVSKSHELLASTLEERHNSLSFLSMGKQSGPLQTEQADEKAKEQIQGAEEFFQYLPVESAFSDFSKSADEPGDLSIVSEQNPEIRKSAESDVCSSPEDVQRRALERDEANLHPYSPTENFRSPSLSPVENENSFYQLFPDHGAVKNALGPTHSRMEDLASREENLCFVELPVVSTNRKCEMVTENVMVNGDLEMVLSRCTLHAVGGQSSPRRETILSLPPEMNSEASLSPVQSSVQQSGCVPDALQQPNVKTTQAKDSNSSVLPISIPVWETETGRGIMEESELIMISSNDISTAESDLDLFHQADNRNEKTENLSYSDHSEVKSCPEVNLLMRRRFLPLNFEVDDDISTQPESYPVIAQNPKEDWSKKCKPTEFTSASGSLQEAFLKRKKDFIERSSKRLEKLKSRERNSEKPQEKASHQMKRHLHKPKENVPTAAVSHLKKVEVKIYSADDRKTSEIQKYQRTSRLYNNLTEVKIRKEEKDRQETYARNRERAREFQKRTLEKLRAKRTLKSIPAL